MGRHGWTDSLHLWLKSGWSCSCCRGPSGLLKLNTCAAHSSPLCWRPFRSPCGCCCHDYVRNLNLKKSWLSISCSRGIACCRRWSIFSRSMQLNLSLLRYAILYTSTRSAQIINLLLLLGWSTVVVVVGADPLPLPIRHSCKRWCKCMAALLCFTAFAIFFFKFFFCSIQRRSIAIKVVQHTVHSHCYIWPWP